jgi:hypothetical protein
VGVVGLVIAAVGMWLLGGQDESVAVVLSAGFLVAVAGAWLGVRPYEPAKLRRAYLLILIGAIAGVIAFAGQIVRLAST